MFHLDFGRTLQILFWMVLVDFYFVGLLVATVLWYLTNKFLTGQRTVHNVEQNVEWAYCFDVHCNSFVPVFMINYLLQLLLVSILFHDTIYSRILGNTMYLVSVFAYIYITFLGYSGNYFY